MARAYANVATALWRDDEFRPLSLAAQHAYLLLMSQPDISAAGVLPLALTRWASRTKDVTRASLRAAIDELETHRFVALDEETEELLVRSFVRWDNGYGNPKRRPVIKDAASHVESGTLRRVLAAELDRLGLPGAEWVGWVPDSHADSQSDSPSGVESSEDHAEAFPQGNSLSDSHADTVSPSERVVVTTAKGSLPQPSTRIPHSASRPSVASLSGGRAHEPRDEPPPARCDEHIRDLSPPPCGACADARRALEAWEIERRASDQAARSAEAHKRAEVTRLAIDACGQCGPDGYLPGGRLCTHDPGQADRTKAGAEMARAQIGGRARPRDLPQDDPLAEAMERQAAKRDAHQARLAEEA